jgi:hypothetical protein
MKKFLASFALVAFLFAFAAPTFAMENEVVTTEQVADEKPKKNDSEKKNEKSDKKSSECTKEKKACCSKEKDKA